MRLARFSMTALLALWCGGAQAANVHVVDGDTLDVDGIRYRLYGIDAPEAGQSCNSKTGNKWKCGKAAIAELERLVLKAQTVECDNRGVDEFGRILAVCLADGVNINEMMIKAGLAWSYRKYAHDYDRLEEEVHKTKAGIWQARDAGALGFPARALGSGAASRARRLPDQGQYLQKRTDLPYAMVALV